MLYKIAIKVICLKKYLSFILLGLGCFFFAGCGKTAGKPVFPDFNPYSVSKIEIFQNDDKYLKIFKGEGKDWFVESSGLMFFANYERIYCFLNLISSLKHLKTLDKDCAELEKMTHKKGVEVKIHSCKKIFSFSLKQAGEDYQSSYIRLEGAKSCVLCTPYINTAVTNPLRKWFKYILFENEIEEILSIAIGAQGGKLLNLRAQPGGTEWINTYDNKKYSLNDVVKLNEVLNRMSVCSGEKPDKKYLFPSPALKIEISSKSGQKSYIHVVGKKNSSFYYARRSQEEKGVLLFSKTWLNKLLNTISNLFDVDIALTDKTFI